MGIFCGNELHECIYYTTKDKKPLIEIKEYPEGMEGTHYLTNNNVAFVLGGEIKYTLLGNPCDEITKGNIIFIPAGENLIYRVVKKCMVIILRINLPAKLCDNYTMKNLYEHGRLLIEKNGNSSVTHRRTGILDINSYMWRYVNDLHGRISDGIRCSRYFEIKIKEFFMILFTYYTKVELYRFFLQILSNDTVFSEHVRLNWKVSKTVSELASSMNLSKKQFSEKFKTVFGKTPYQWMVDEKAKEIHDELLFSIKTIKEISIENGFNTMAQFSNFCKTKLGHCPSEIRTKKRVING